MKMILRKVVLELMFFAIAESLVIRNENNTGGEQWSNESKFEDRENDLSNIFDGVYTQCFLHLSYSCVQRKTLSYIRELNKLPEVSIIGNYVKFVKLNTTNEEDTYFEDYSTTESTEELTLMIDKAVDRFFKHHVMKFYAMGKDVAVPNTAEEFVGRKKRKGGGGGGHGGDDGGKKKMMMMAMMCMKMKLMMMVPAMMGMMGMMSFKGMMFSMMSFMIAKMMLLMKILEKKGGGGGGGGGDAGWQAGGGGGAWMPAGPDYGGGGGGYDANGQWQSRSYLEKTELDTVQNKPITSYVKPLKLTNADMNVYTIPLKHGTKLKSRKKRGIIDIIQNAYTYWVNKILGNNIRRKSKPGSYKIVNGVKYVYYPLNTFQKLKGKEVQNNIMEETKPAIITDFNKGEIMEGPVESRMNTRKFHKMKDAVNNTVEDNPWQ